LSKALSKSPIASDASTFFAVLTKRLWRSASDNGDFFGGFGGLDSIMSVTQDIVLRPSQNEQDHSIVVRLDPDLVRAEFERRSLERRAQRLAESPLRYRLRQLLLAGVVTLGQWAAALTK
jgi:hypothetical protein